MTPIFTMMCGLSRSGKSHEAKRLAEEQNAIIFSSDALRDELFGDVNDQGHNQELFVELHRRIKECLKSGKNAIMDATNLNYKKRMSFLQELKSIPCKKHCVFMATPYEECLRRNGERERKVPVEAIKRMYNSISIPWYTEGWDKIIIKYSEKSEDSYGSPVTWIVSANDFCQDNPHHALTLGQHCEVAYEYIATYGGSPELRCATLLHDIGKTKTKAFFDSRGNPSEHAHYYSHNNCGSYDSLFFKFNADHLYVAVLICWHMQPYFWEKDNNEKLHNKYKKLWGDQLYDDIMKLHDADKHAH